MLVGAGRRIVSYSITIGWVCWLGLVEIAYGGHVGAGRHTAYRVGALVMGSRDSTEWVC